MRNIASQCTFAVGVPLPPTWPLVLVGLIALVAVQHRRNCLAIVLAWVPVRGDRDAEERPEGLGAVEHSPSAEGASATGYDLLGAREEHAVLERFQFVALARPRVVVVTRFECGVADSQAAAHHVHLFLA